MKSFSLVLSARGALATQAALAVLVLVGCGGAASKPASTPMGYGAMSASPARAALSEASATTVGGTDMAKDSNGALAQNSQPPPVAPPPPGTTSSGAPAAVVKDAAVAQMLIYTADVTIAVFQVEAQMNAVEKVAKDVGGYLSSRSDQVVVIRVPRDRFDEAIHKVESLGDVLHRAISAQDVTDQYVDLQARLKNAYVMRDRLTDLLKLAMVKDALEIEKELGRITESIEQMEGQLKLLGDKVAYSTLSVSFQAVNPQSVPETQFQLPFPWIQDLGLTSLLSVHQ